MSSSLRAAAGSFPHTRGTLRCRLYGAPGRRFIPAYAGNARWQGSHHRHRPVHPRMRGERSKKPRTFWRHFGSSPHTRGTLHLARGQRGLQRFIPACAGNARPDTPVTPMAIGSSPHARGTLIRIHPDTDRRRFIPAYAGNASATQPTAGETPVHPRIRGER